MTLRKGTNGVRLAKGIADRPSEIGPFLFLFVRDQRNFLKLSSEGLEYARSGLQGIKRCVPGNRNKAEMLLCHKILSSAQIAEQ